MQQVMERVDDCRWYDGGGNRVRSEEASDVGKKVVVKEVKWVDEGINIDEGLAGSEVIAVWSDSS